MRSKLTKIAYATGILLALSFVFSCSSDGDGNATASGSCDIKDYRIVEIGEQVWMAENLNCGVSGSKCYNNDPANCAKYGQLYNWSTAMALPSSCNNSTCSSTILSKHRGICPGGWHIPNDAEWATLINYVENDKDCSNCAETYLKATNDWNSSIVNLDSYGFPPCRVVMAMPEVVSSTISATNGNWWSSTSEDSNYAYVQVMGYGNGTYNNNLNKNFLLSIRCLQD